MSLSGRSRLSTFSRTAPQSLAEQVLVCTDSSKLYSTITRWVVTIRWVINYTHLQMGEFAQTILIIRWVVLCKDGDGKVGLRVQSMDKVSKLIFNKEVQEGM